jgi:hypothetical protein
LSGSKERLPSPRPGSRAGLLPPSPLRSRVGAERGTGLSAGPFLCAPLRTGLTRFRIHRSPVLAAITSRRQAAFGPGRYSPYSRMLDLHVTRRRVQSTYRPSLPHLSMASSVPWRFRQRCPFGSTRSEAGPDGQGQRLPTFTVLPSASRRRCRLGQFVTATRPRTSQHVFLPERQRP